MGEEPDIQVLTGEVLRRHQAKKSQEPEEPVQTVTHPVSTEEVDGEITTDTDQAAAAGTQLENIQSDESDGEIWAFRFRRPSFSMRKVPEFKVVFDAQDGASVENSEWFMVSPEYMKTSKFHICVGIGSKAYMDRMNKLRKYVNLQDIHLMSPFHMESVPVNLLYGYLQDTSRDAGTELIFFTPIEDFGTGEG